MAGERATVNPSFLNFQLRMKAQHEVSFRSSNMLTGIANTLFAAGLSEPIQKITRLIARVVVNSNGSVMTLCANGYGNDAAKIARSMLEGAITIAYLRKHPELVNDYIDFGKVKMWKFYEETKDIDGIAPQSQEVVDQLKAEFDSVAERFKNKDGKLLGSWCRSSVKQMAMDVGLADFYPMFYGPASGMEHVDITGLIHQRSDAGIPEVEIAPSEQFVTASVAMGFMATLRALWEFDEATGGKMKARLEAANRFYNENINK